MAVLALHLMERMVRVDSDSTLVGAAGLATGAAAATRSSSLSSEVPLLFVAVSLKAYVVPESRSAADIVWLMAPGELG